MEINKIYNEDCIEGMKQIHSKSIDCIICDLPYGVLNKGYDISIDRIESMKGNRIKMV